MSTQRTEKIKKTFLSLFMYLLWIIASACLFFYFCSKCIRDNFDQVTVSQVLLHLNIDENAELPTSLIISMVKYALYFFACSAALFYFTYISAKGKNILFAIYNDIKRLYDAIKIIFNSISTCHIALSCIVVLIIISAYTFARFDNRMHIVDYLTQEESIFFTDNYYKLDVNNISSSNKNLLVLFIESLEDGYKNSSIYGDNLIEGLVDLKSEGISFSNYKKTPGAYYTMDGICAQLLGVPLLHISYNVINKRDATYKASYGKALLANTPSIFNLLKNMSYETVAFCGSSRNFTHKGAHLEAHGIDTVWAREYWEEKGFNNDIANMGNKWGFNDEFLFNRLKEYLTKRTSDKKFAVFFETLDTHVPVGYVTEEDKHFGDMRDAVIRATRLSTEFIEWAKTQAWYKDTVIVIVGDHPYMDFKIRNSLTKFTKKSKNRQIFNLILNSEAQPVRKIKGWSSMDMAPTILHAMGISFTSHSVSGNVSHTNIGIGTSLFSNEATLIEKYGAKKLTEELMKPNKFYDTLL